MRSVRESSNSSRLLKNHLLRVSSRLFFVADRLHFYLNLYCVVAFSRSVSVASSGFLRNRFLGGKPEKLIFGEESPDNLIEAYDLGEYNTGPLTKLEILDEGC